MPTTWDAGAGLCMSMGKQPSQCLELGRCSLTVSSTTPYPYSLPQEYTFRSQGYHTKG